MKTQQVDERFFVFFAVWIVLGIASFVFFHFSRDAKLKRRILPFWLGLVGVLFVGFVVWTSHGQFSGFLPVIIPMVVLIMFLNYRMIRFCDACGRTLYRQPVISKPRFCSHCGAAMGGGSQTEKEEAQPARPDNGG